MILMLMLAIAIFYVLKLPPRHVSLKDLSPTIVPQTVQSDPAVREPAMPGIPATDSIDNELICCYIIVESLSDITLAQKKAEKLRKEFNADFILLPPTKEGLFRISCGKYSTPEEAKSSIEIIRNKIRPDAWIYSVIK